MKVTTWVEVSRDVDVWKEDLWAACSASTEPGETWLQALNRVAIALTALPEAEIATWTPQKRKIIVDFLAAQAERFQEKAPAADTTR